MGCRPCVHAAVQRKTRVASAPSLAGAHRRRGQQVMLLLSLDEDSQAGLKKVHIGGQQKVTSSMMSNKKNKYILWVTDKLGSKKDASFDALTFITGVCFCSVVSLINGPRFTVGAVAVGQTGHKNQRCVDFVCCQVCCINKMFEQVNDHNCAYYVRPCFPLTHQYSSPPVMHFS